MYAVYYTIGLLFCYRGDLEKTLSQIKETWDISREESIKDMDSSFRLRIILLFAITFIVFIGIYNTKLLKLGLSSSFLCIVLYYLCNPQGIVLHIVRQLKRIYPLRNKIP